MPATNAPALFCHHQDTPLTEAKVEGESTQKELLRLIRADVENLPCSFVQSTRSNLEVVEPAFFLRPKAEPEAWLALTPPLSTIAEAFEVEDVTGTGSSSLHFAIDYLGREHFIKALDWVDEALEPEPTRKLLVGKTMPQQSLARLRYEIDMMGQVSCRIRPRALFEADETYYLVMPRLSCDLLALWNCEDLSDHEKAAASLLSSLHIAKDLRAAHQRGILHGDVKPENVLLLHNTMVLTDWGHAYKAPLALTNVRIGTYAWRAPEICRGKDGGVILTEACDMWSLGALALNLLGDFGGDLFSTRGIGCRPCKSWHWHFEDEMPSSEENDEYADIWRPYKRYFMWRARRRDTADIDCISIQAVKALCDPKLAHYFTQVPQLNSYRAMDKKVLRAYNRHPQLTLFILNRLLLEEPQRRASATETALQLQKMSTRFDELVLLQALARNAQQMKPHQPVVDVLRSQLEELGAWLSPILEPSEKSFAEETTPTVSYWISNTAPQNKVLDSCTGAKSADPHQAAA